MKYKIIAFLLIVAAILFGTGITYSIFHSNTSAVNNQNIAQFIFNAEQTDHLELSLVDLKPGTEENYNFSVKNSDDYSTSNVLTEYKITAKSLHLMPLTIELYKNGDLTPVMSCGSGSITRDSNGDLICNSQIGTLQLDSQVVDNYVLKVIFPDTFSNEKYSNLVDYIDLDISSWQKIKE